MVCVEFDRTCEKCNYRVTLFVGVFLKICFLCHSSYVMGPNLNSKAVTAS